MIIITKQSPLIVIETPDTVLYQGVQDFAGGFDVEDDIAQYYQDFNAPITDFNMAGNDITSIEDFQDAIETLTS